MWGVSFILLFFQNSLTAQNSSIEDVIDDRGEAVVKVLINNKQQAVYLNQIASVEKVYSDAVLMYLNRDQFKTIKSLGLKTELYSPYYSNSRAITMAYTTAEMANWDKYPTWSVYQDMMLNFAASYPDICALDTIGFSEEGRALLVVKISDNVSTDETEPEFFLTGQMHGDELVGYILPLRMIDYLLSNYGSNDQVDNLVNSLELWINPLSNPDGTYGNSETDVSSATRYNANGIDLNRNFPDPNGSWNPDGNETAAENLAMMNFAAQRHFVMSANSHAGAELVNYPWDSWEELHADDDWLYETSRKYADTAQANSPSGYMTQQDDGITNGYAWYTTDGSRQDYFNYYEHCREVTLEWSDPKLLDAEELPAHWNYNRNALLNYFEEATEGIHGIITDSVTGEPIEAEVFIEGHDERNTQVYSDLPNGDYHRLLAAGSWHLQYSKEGYQTKTLQFELEQDETINQNVQLVPLSILPPQVDFVVNDTAPDCSGQIHFINLTQAVGDVTYAWDFGDGSVSSIENPVHTYYQNGSYTISLTAENENGTDTETKTAYLQINLTEMDSVHNASLCEPSGSMTLEAFSSGNVYWYENQEDAASIASGQTFNTPDLTSSQTYYAEAVFPGANSVVGEADDSEGGSYSYDGIEHSLIFDCYETCLIEQVTVYAENSGERTISLKNNLGDVLDSKTINIPAGEQTISLNFLVQPGTDLRLSANADCGLLRGESGWTSTFDYPYEWSAYLSIKDSDSGSGWLGSDRFYPYFYNWQVATPDCYSERVPVFAALNEPPQAAFSASHNGLTVDFENESVYAQSWSWDFGDGNASVEESPQHTYTSAGQYEVQLTAENDCGIDIHSETITVSETGLNDAKRSDVTCYPNPADTKLNVHVGSLWDGALLQVYNAAGQIVYQTVCNRKEMHINTAGWDNGLYLLRLNTLEKTLEQKIIIQ